MKVLVRKEAAEKPKVTDILNLADGGGVMKSLDGQHEATEGVVKNVTEAPIKKYLAQKRVIDDRYEGWDKDEMREIRSFGKMLSSHDEDDTVTPEIKGLTVRIPIKEREREPIAVGDTVAFCETAKPGYLLNARATVLAITANKVRIRMDDGDYERLKRSGKDRIAKETQAPIGIVEKVS